MCTGHTGTTIEDWRQRGMPLQWQMLHHIAVVTPRNRKRYAAMFEASDLPKVRLATRAALQGFYRAEALDR